LASSSNEILTTLLFNIESNSANLKKGLDDAKSQVSNFSSQIGTIAKVVAGAFAVEKIVSFGKECAQLAIEAEGVESAFSHIPNSTALLKDLSQSVEGTQSNLKLMKLSVEAMNNNVPLENLGSILKFVDATADSTGQSFDELASRLIQNIGKESTKGLNDFGLSIKNVKDQSDKIGFVPALLEEINAQSKRLGDINNDNADAIDRASASWDNFKLAFGKKITSSSTIADVLDASSLLLGRTTRTAGEIDQIRKGQKAVYEDYLKAKNEGDNDRVKEDLQILANLSKELNDVKDKSVEYKDAGVKPLQKEIENLGNLNEKLKTLQEEQLTLTGQQLIANENEVESIQQKIEALRNLALTQKADSITKKSFIAGGGYDTTVSTLPSSKVSEDFGLKKTQIDDVNLSVVKLTESTKNLNLTLDETGTVSQKAIGSVATNAIASLGVELGNMIASGKAGFQDLTRTILEAISKLILGFLAQSIAATYANETGKEGVYGIAIATAAAGVLAGIFESLIVPSYAVGTDNHPGGLALVGEQGAELVNLPRGSQVYTNNQTNKLLSGGGGGLDITIKSMTRGEDLYYAIQEVTRRRGKQ